MARTAAIGIQDFEQLMQNNYFYISPRRFGKTLAMSMLEKFFSVSYKDRGDLLLSENRKNRYLLGKYQF